MQRRASPCVSVITITAGLISVGYGGCPTTPQTDMPTIALVDDDHNVLSSLSITLRAEGYRVATYTDGGSALDGFQAAPPDLAILDMKMPDMDGMETLRQLRAKSKLPVILLASTEEVSDEVFALQTGADDFIRKPFSQRLLVERVRAVLRRALPKDGLLLKTITSTLERGALRMDTECHTCTWKNKRVTLTASEFVILHALASRPGVVRGRDALMELAYDGVTNGDQRNIDSHIKRLRRKFKASDSEFDSVQTLYGVGYCFKEI